MTILLTKYNKIIIEAFEKLSAQFHEDIQVKWLDMSKYGHSFDLLPISHWNNVLNSLLPFDCIMIGDVFWPTGQAFCEWGKTHNKTVCFLQHGQWIYIENKKKLNYYPDITMVYGTNVADMINQWPYGKESNVIVTGSPRYDNLEIVNGDYVYFSPPVIQEIVHGRPNGYIQKHYLMAIQSVIGLDSVCKLVIQPHYREANINMLKNMFPKAMFVDPAENAIKLISSSYKVVCCRNSTVVIDSIACKKHVLLMDFLYTDRSFYPREYFNNFATENDNATDLLNNISNTKIIVDYEKHASNHILLGNSSERIMSVLSNVV